MTLANTDYPGIWLNEMASPLEQREVTILYGA